MKITAILMAFVLLALSCAGAPEPPAQVSLSLEAGIQRVYLGESVEGSISLVGDFNDWDSTATPFELVEGEGLVAEVDLSPGSYKFLLVLNDRYLSPENFPDFSPSPLDYESDGTGSTVGIWYVEETVLTNIEE